MRRPAALVIALLASACASGPVPTFQSAPSPSSGAFEPVAAPTPTWQELAALDWPAPQIAFVAYDATVRNVLWAVYADGGTELYCRAEFTATDAAAHAIGIEALTWEHVYPADLVADGLGFEDRDCEVPKPGVAANQPACRAAIADMHNLWPAYGRINSSRSNHPYGELPSEGTNNPNFASICPDFERVYNATPVYIEPTIDARGDIARALIYMHFVYGLDLARVMDDLNRLLEWIQGDPVDQDELERELAIIERQATGNPLIVSTTPAF